MDIPYSNRELDEKFIDIKEQLNRIEAQTTATNGKVRNLQMWRAYTLGFCAAVSLLLLPVLLMLVNKFV